MEPRSPSLTNVSQVFKKNASKNEVAPPPKKHPQHPLKNTPQKQGCTPLKKLFRKPFKNHPPKTVSYHPPKASPKTDSKITTVKLLVLASQLGRATPTPSLEKLRWCPCRACTYISAGQVQRGSQLLHPNPRTKRQPQLKRWEGDSKKKKMYRGRLSGFSKILARIFQ